MVWLNNCSLRVKQQSLTHSNVVVFLDTVWRTLQMHGRDIQLVEDEGLLYYHCACPLEMPLTVLLDMSH